MTLVQVTDHVFERATSPLESNELLVTGFGYEKSTSSSYETVFNSGILFHNRKDKHKRKLY